MDEIQPPFEEKINIEDLVLSSNQTEMQDVRNNTMSIEIKQERVEYRTKLLHVENENTLLRKKLEESMSLQKVLTEKLASSAIKIQQIQGEKIETTGNFTRSEVEKDKLRVELANTKQELEKSLVRIEKLKSQNQKYKGVISVLISAQDESSKEIQVNEQDTVSNDHLDAVEILENKLDLKTDDQSKVRDQATVVKIPIKKKNKHLKTKSNVGEKKTYIDENTKTLEQIANFDISLDNHESRVHERPKNVKLTKLQPKSHEIIYAGEKKFACKFCKKRFTKHQKVKYHESIHTGEKPHACKYCEKRFIQPNSLKHHELIHTGEKPYSCNTCAYRCRQKGNLKKHEILHTAGKRVRNHLPASSVM